jgi:hypothetical protein
MELKDYYIIAADLILLIHVLIVVFVIFGLLLIVTGKCLAWSWVRNPWFRLIHLMCIAIIALQSWLGVFCPLTIWEMTLRTKANDTVYRESFMSYWLGKILYYQAPEWAFTLGYTLFGLLVVICWFWARPRRFDRNKNRCLK